MTGKPSSEGEDIKAAVRDLYAKVAEGTSSCCGDDSPGMLTGAAAIQRIGYDPDEVAALPETVTESNAGCGNPIADASPAPGEVVLDLGSGAGLDCFLAARAVGPRGRAIGLDMTDAMLAKAERNRRAVGADNVEFRKGEMENMPVEDASVDIIISNCVINLSPDKNAVFRESFRVLRPGGRFVVSDVLKTGASCCEGSVEEWCACIAGAITAEAYLDGLRSAGFESAEIVREKPYIAEGYVSAIIRARKGGA